MNDLQFQVAWNQRTIPGCLFTIAIWSQVFDTQFWQIKSTFSGAQSAIFFTSPISSAFPAWSFSIIPFHPLIPQPSIPQILNEPPTPLHQHSHSRTPPGNPRFRPSLAGNSIFSITFHCFDGKTPGSVPFRGLSASPWAPCWTPPWRPTAWRSPWAARPLESRCPRRPWGAWKPNDLELDLPFGVTKNYGTWDIRHDFVKPVQSKKNRDLIWFDQHIMGVCRQEGFSKQEQLCNYSEDSGQSVHKGRFLLVTTGWSRVVWVRGLLQNYRN